MEQTIKALAELRKHWSLQGHPNISDIARRANIARGTAHRYLTGETKGGTVETVRALANAMGRPDIADSIPYTTISSVSNTEDYIAEMVQQWQERSQQQMAELTAKHKQEMDDLIRDHRLEREDWHAQRKAMHEENANLRASFDKAVTFRDAQLKAHRTEKWICMALFVVAVALLIALLIVRK